MSHRSRTGTFEVNVCYQEKTSRLLVTDSMTVESFLPIAVHYFLQEKGSTEQYKFIYAGSVLNNEMLLKDLHLCSASVLHIVNTEKKNHLSSKNQDKELQQPQFSFYVYCYECKDIASAQLRIKCLQCNQCQKFLIDKDHGPKCREDLLSCDKSISGVCKYSGCTGKTAKYEFHCRKHPKRNAVLLKHIFNNSQHYSCITCEEDLNPILIYPCEKGHAMCLDCFKIYCDQYLLERKFRLTDHCYSIRCPAHCEQSFIQEAHHFRILGDTKYEEYQSQATMTFLQNTYSVYCPNPNCKDCFQVDLAVTDITCYSCHHTFCRQCSNEVHDGPCGREAVEGSDLYPDNQMAQQSATLINKISKKCPKCEVNVEKSGGCNHMTCQCEAEWCWVCGKTWSTECLGEHWFD